MTSKDFFQALDDLQEQKGINKDYFVEALESALTSAYKKNFGEAKSAFVKLDPEKNSIKVYSYKTVVDEITDPDKEILLGDAKLILQFALGIKNTSDYEKKDEPTVTTPPTTSAPTTSAPAASA